LIANQQARSILDNSADFGQITPENAMKVSNFFDVI